MNRYKNALLFAMIFAAVFAAGARGGPLRLLQPGGTDSSITGTLDFSESDLDMQKPAFLLDRTQGHFSITKEFETAIDQKKKGQTLYLLTSKKNKMELFYPFNKSRNFKSAYACDRFLSHTKFISEKISGTSLYATGKGSSNAFAQQFGPVRVGYFVNFSRDRGSGVSEEINSRLESLSPDAMTFLLLKARSEGYQISARLGKWGAVSFLKSAEDITARLNFVDAGADFELPGNITGERREIGYDYDISHAWRVSAAYNHAALGNLDSITYNVTHEIGRWLTASEYKLRSLYVSKTASPKHSWRIGLEDYSGGYDMAGTIDIFGASANFISGIYVYHSNGFLDRRTLKYGCKWSKGNYTYKLGYAYSWGKAFLHADIGKRQFFNYATQYDQSDAYDFSQHQLGLGFEKRIFKNTVMKYTLLQNVPNMSKIETGPQPAPTNEPVIKKKTRGGTLQLMSVEYLF